jgi:hypothetical protein
MLMLWNLILSVKMAQYVSIPAIEYNFIWQEVSIVIFNMILMCPIYIDVKHNYTSLLLLVHFSNKIWGHLLVCSIKRWCPIVHHCNKIYNFVCSNQLFVKNTDIAVHAVSKLQAEKTCCWTHGHESKLNIYLVCRKCEATMARFWYWNLLQAALTLYLVCNVLVFFILMCAVWRWVWCCILLK